MSCFIKLKLENGNFTFINIDLVPELRARKDATGEILGSNLFLAEDEVIKVMETPAEIITKIRQNTF